MGGPLPLVPIAVDPPDHVRYRRLLDPFAPRRLAPLEPALRRQVGTIVDGIVGRSGFDAIADLAVPYPSQVFLTLFGLPLADREQLLAWKDGLLKAVDPTGGELDPGAMDAALGLFEYVQRSVAERRHGDGNDLMTELLQVTEEGGLTDEDVIGLSFLFVLAGLDTVTTAIGSRSTTWRSTPTSGARSRRTSRWFRRSSRRCCGSSSRRRCLLGSRPGTTWWTASPSTRVARAPRTRDPNRDSAQRDDPDRLDVHARSEQAFRVRYRRAPLPRLPPGAHGASPGLGGVPAASARLRAGSPCVRHDPVASAALSASTSSRSS